MASTNSSDAPLAFLRLVWIDVSGVRRCRCVPMHTSPKRGADSFAVVASNATPRAKRLWVHHRSSLALCCYFLPCYGDEGVVETAWERGDIVLAPASGAMSVIQLPGSCDWLAATAIISPSGPSTQLPHPWCPRALLASAVKRLHDVFGMKIDVGFETEFVLLDAKTREPLESSVYCQTSGFDIAAEVLRDITSSLGRAGQTVLHVHGESAPGQFEIVTDHSDDVVAQADAFVARKEVIQRVARKHGLLASFLPKIWSTQAGNASHVHFSLKRARNGVPFLRRRNRDAEEGQLVHDVLSPQLADFIAGILANIGGLLLHTVGSPNSWRRVQPGCWAGAYACWGVQNKEALLRVVDARENHVEFKAFDGTANPYLGLAGLVCAGMAGLARRGGVDGVDGKGALPPPVSIDPQHSKNVPRLPTASFEELVKASLGNHVDEKFARSADEGFMEHQWLESMRSYCEDAEGEFQAFFEDFARVKLAEVERFKAMAFEEEVELLLDRY